MFDCWWTCTFRNLSEPPARWSVHAVFITHHTTQNKTQTKPTESTKFIKAHQVATAASSKPLPTQASETESLARSSAALPYSGSLQSPPPGHCSEPCAISLLTLKQTLSAGRQQEAKEDATAARDSAHAPECVEAGRSGRQPGGAAVVSLDLEAMLGALIALQRRTTVMICFPSTAF